MKRLKILTAALLAAVVTTSMSSITCSAAATIQEPTYPSNTKQTTITWWSWTSSADKIVADFEKAYPNIKVEHPTIGAGSNEYSKLQTVLKAGTGAPDVVQIEYQYLPQFIEMNGLQDISQYVNQYKSSFQDWTWAQCSRGSKVYAVPEDVGPLMFIYRTSVFQKNGISAPKTYDELEAAAKTLHDKDPQTYMTFFPYNDPGQIVGFLWQAGSQLFTYQNNTWYVNINNSTSKKVMNYWSNMIKKGYVKATSDGTPTWQSEIANGKYASVIGASWYPTYSLTPYVKPSTNDWKASDTPQWDSSSFVNGNWGGSTNAVTTQSKNVEAASLFAAWINSSNAGVNRGITDRGLFPADKYGTQLDAFNKPNASLSNQQVGSIFTKAASAVNTSFQWSPWTDYVYKQMTTEFTNASAGKETFDQALDNIQANVVSFAKTSGYTVQEGAPTAAATSTASGAVSGTASAAASTATASSTSGGVNMGAVIAVIVILVVVVLAVLLKRRSLKGKSK